MKWTQEVDSQLERMVAQGQRHDEIASHLGVTIKSVNNRCFRLGLKTVYKKVYECMNCKKDFLHFTSQERKFCSHRCSGLFNSVGKVCSERTKMRISEALTGRVVDQSVIDKISGENNPNWIDGRSIGQRTERVKGKRKCTYCNDFNIERKHKTICDKCRLEYYKAYRPACEFRFDVHLFKEEFDFSLLAMHGWYSPSNKGNNLSGVSRDHLYSVKDGFVNKVDADLISHPANCKLMKHSDNSSKNSHSAITLDELKERIARWDQKYGSMA